MVVKKSLTLTQESDFEEFKIEAPQNPPNQGRKRRANTNLSPELKQMKLEVQNLKNGLLKQEIKLNLYRKYLLIIKTKALDLAQKY